jgi:hypothetical protein
MGRLSGNVDPISFFDVNWDHKLPIGELIVLEQNDRIPYYFACQVVNLIHVNIVSN